MILKKRWKMDEKIPPAVENEIAPGGIFMRSVSAGAVFRRHTAPTNGHVSMFSWLAVCWNKKDAGKFPASIFSSERGI